MSQTKTIYFNHVDKLVECLPMDDTLFITKLSKQQLLPGNTQSKIEELSTQADKASYFLSHVIKPALVIDDTSEPDVHIASGETKYPVYLSKSHLRKRPWTHAP